MKELFKKLAKLYVSSGQQERDKKIMQSSRNLLLEDMLEKEKRKNEEKVGNEIQKETCRD